VWHIPASTALKEGQASGLSTVPEEHQRCNKAVVDSMFLDRNKIIACITCEVISLFRCQWVCTAKVDANGVDKKSELVDVL